MGPDAGDHCAGSLLTSSLAYGGMNRAIRALASLSLSAPAPQSAASASAIGTAARVSLKRRLATAASSEGRGRKDKEEQPGGGAPQRDDDALTDEAWEAATQDPANVAFRRDMVKNATRMDWNDRVPVNFAAIEAAEFEDEAAAAGAGKSVDAWRRSAKGGRRELADVVLDNPDAVFRVEPPSPQAHVTSLTADPYGWPMSSRLPKQAP